jgi:F-type H+-transporting ATPase subunit epsilon
MHLILLTPAAELTNQPIASAIVPGTSGDFGVLPGHMPFISTLRANDPLDLSDDRFNLGK